MKVLVTGVAGFIGSQTARTLLARGDDVIGLDNLNDYYDVNLKLARLARLQGQNNFHFIKADLADRHEIERVFEEHRPERVINLAAQAGVRYAFENPHSYVNSNLVGFLHILEGCRHHGVEHLVYASSSSVYGANTRMPFSIHDNVDHPLNLYAASKKANELMAHSYSHLYELPVTGLRFFTVYGPWGRPDMSLFLFTKKIIAGEPIDVFNFGQHARDFTFIDDIVEGVVRTLDKVATPNPDWNGAEPDPGTALGWRVNPWVKQGILLGFRLGAMVQMGGDEFSFVDKSTYPARRFDPGQGVRVVPGGSTVREGAFLARGVVCMPPMYVNAGAYVDEGTMVDSHALVGSCAQIGKRVHLSAAAQIGGVLEPVNATPVIIEDDVLIGGNTGVYEGTLVRRRAVLAAGTILTRGTPVYDIVRGEVLKASADHPLVIPEGAVVVPGSRELKRGAEPAWGLSLYTPVIVKYRDDKTDLSATLEELLR